MPMQMWLTRPGEFEKLDQAINDACCAGRLDDLTQWVEMLDAVVAGNQPTGIGTSTGVFPGPGQSHFTRHWVGDFANELPPEYWPYAWGKPAEWKNPPAGQPDNRLRLDRMMSFALSWSIRKVIGARQMVDAGNADQWNHPACSPCRNHLTVWVCFELSEVEKKLAAADLEYRKHAFRLGVIESRDTVVMVVKTPRPLEDVGGICDPQKDNGGGAEDVYREPVLVTHGFTANEVPRWNQPISTAETVLGSATVHPVEEQPLPQGGHMPAGTYPEDAHVELCNFVRTPRTLGELSAGTTSDLIKQLLLNASQTDGYQVPGRLDLSEELISRLKISIADERTVDHRAPQPGGETSAD